jgi:hypothetical protein
VLDARFLRKIVVDERSSGTMSGHKHARLPEAFAQQISLKVSIAIWAVLAHSVTNQHGRRSRIESV